MNFLQQRKPLSYALNRAKKLHNASGKTALIKEIKSGRIRVWAKHQAIFNSDICYSFPNNKLGFIAKSRSQENSDRQAYDIAYNDMDPPENEKLFSYHGEQTIFLWRGLELSQELNNAVISLYDDCEIDVGKSEVSLDLIFGEDMDSLSMAKTRIYVTTISKVSRYRHPCNLTLIEAEGLECSKADVEEFFPFSREQRSGSPVGRQPKYSKIELFHYLDAHPIQTQNQANKKHLRLAINNFFDGQYEDGGPSDKTRSRYLKEYLVIRHK